MIAITIASVRIIMIALSKMVVIVILEERSGRQTFRFCFAKRRESQSASCSIVATMLRPRGTDSAFALDKATRNCAVSADHLPPTSAAKTTKRALLHSPVSSGWVLSFVRLAAASATPALVAAPGCAVPSLLRADTCVVSMACAPRNVVRPSATTSRRLLSMTSNTARSMSLTKTFVVTRPRLLCTPAQRQLQGGNLVDVGEGLHALTSWPLRPSWTLVSRSS